VIPGLIRLGTLRRQAKLPLWSTFHYTTLKLLRVAQKYEIATPIYKVYKTTDTKNSYGGNDRKKEVLRRFRKTVSVSAEVV